MREQVINGINKWVGSLIDGIAPDNLLFALASRPIKRVIGQYIEDNLNYDTIKPFIVSTNGSIDATTTINEVMESLRTMPKKKYTFQGIEMEIGEGAVVIYIPDNPTLGMLTDHLKKVTLNEKDFLKLAEYINE